MTIATPDQTITETTTPSEQTEPSEQVTPMKPSEALRLGAMSTKQSFGQLHETVDGEDRYCALGTIAYALGFRWQ